MQFDKITSDIATNLNGLLKMSKTASRENHFVPQFYLRSFSVDQKRLNLFNFSRRKTITGASIKHQCSRRNFYKFAPKLENTFADLEGEVAQMIRCIKATGDIPDEQSDDWAALLGFIVFQKLRTTNTGKSFDGITHYFGDFLSENTATSNQSDPTYLNIKNARSVEVPLRIAGEILPIASDLKGHLFVNKTNREFITSDDPVVLYNQYCEDITYLGVTGWNCRGLQVFWPISPRELVVLYDHSIYKVGRSHRGSTVTELTDKQDIFQLNSLQILNAHHNIYFAGINGLNIVEAECKALGNRRPKTRSRIVESEAIESKPGESDGLIHWYDPLLPAKLSVSKITVRRNWRRIPLHTRAQMNRKNTPRTYNIRIPSYYLPSGRYAVKKITEL